MTGWLTVGLAVVAASSVWAWRPPRTGTGRLAAVGATVHPEPDAHPSAGGVPVPGGPVRWPPLVAVAGAAALGWSVGGLLGWLVAAIAGWALVGWLRRAEPPAVREDRRTRAAALPSVVDLMVACLRAGASQQEAVATVAAAASGSLRLDLERVARRLAHGAAPDAAWSLREAPDLLRLSRVLGRSAATGAPAADLLDAVAGDLRAERREAWLADARLLGTRTAAPLGLCFLPGFVLLGVVPTVVGLAGQLW